MSTDAELPATPEVVENEHYTVIEHSHDEASGAYHVIVAREVTQGDRLIALLDFRDVAFDDKDERWFTADGERRSDEAVAAEQRLIVKSTIEADQEKAKEEAQAAAQPRVLPGAGESL